MNDTMELEYEAKINLIIRKMKSIMDEYQGNILTGTPRLALQEQTHPLIKPILRHFKKAPVIPTHLIPLMENSVLRMHERGMRRYFPIPGKQRQGWNYLFEAYYISTGIRTTDRGVIDMAILNNSLDTYVEPFDGKLWVRTVIALEEAK